MLQGVLTAPGMAELLEALGAAGVTAPCVAEAESIPEEKGAYALLIRLDRGMDIDLRNREPAYLQPGWFVYLGSANGPGGLRARLRRHFRADKKPHWHADRLTVGAAELAAIAVCGGNECDLVARLLKHPAFCVAIGDFGNSDCRTCDSHLLRFRAD